MLLDFTSVRTRTVTMNDFAASLSLEQLRLLTETSVERMLALLDGATDADVVFVPEANDDAAADPSDRRLAWTLGHNVVHATASADEYAWESITTIGQCRQRLEESRRIRVASLKMWPDEPHLENGYIAWGTSGWVNAKGIFVWGLAHDADHEGQMRKILEQARAFHAAG
jgi:hypothetical protein